MIYRGASDEEVTSYQALLGEICALKDEVQELKARLAEADELRRAISEGDLDAIVIPGPDGEMIFTLDGADRAYRVLVETMNEGTATLAHDGTIHYCNRNFSELIGAPIQAVLGTSIHRFIAPEDLVAFKALMAQEISCGEVRLLTEGGKPLPVYLSISPMHADESTSAWCLVVTDLTAQKKSEEILASERLARSIIEQAAEAIIVCDTSGRITRFSNATPKICVCDPAFQRFEDLIDLQFSEGPGAGSSIRPVSEALKGTSILGVEATFGRSDSRAFHLLLNSGPLKNSDGEIIGCVVTLTDITDRKRAQEALQKANDELEMRVLERTAELEEANRALRESEQRLILAQKAGGVGVFDSDLITGEIIWTPELEKVYGMPAPADPRKRHDVWLSCVHPEERELVPKIMQQWLKSTESELEGEYRFIRPDGHERWIAGRSLVIRDSHNRPLRIIGTNTDITERKMAENELRRAKDQALEAAEAKAAFLANMSHELRTPMNAIIGFSSLLLDEPLTPDQKDCVERIRIGGESLLALINDVLDFSKAEKQKVELYSQPLSLRSLIEESLDMVAVAAGSKGLDLAYTIKYGTPDVIVGDHGRLRQVLVNLLSNAVKFTDIGDVSLSVSSKPIEGNRHRVLFEVRDTGIGIPPENLDKLFQPFSQLENGLSSKRDGTGLGLAISKSFVQLMGGWIWAESTPGLGSKFCFTVDVEIAKGEIMDSRRPAKAAIENLAAQKPLRILVAEDNSSNQKVLVEMLKKRGYRADMAADGLEVLEALERQPYDLVLMDIKMPEMDGIRAAQEIIKRWPKNHPRIVAITAYAMEGDREKCLESGMDGYLAKPVKMDDLAMMLRNIAPFREE